MGDVGDWYGWHFLREGGVTRDGIRVEPGQTLRVEPPVIPCKRGLHASRRALDALSYAPGPVVEYVRLSGRIVEEGNKAAATERTCLWLADATRVLHAFACWRAERLLVRERAAGHEPDPREWAAIEVKRRWLKGEATNAELKAAEAAVRTAVWDTG